MTKNKKRQPRTAKAELIDPRRANQRWACILLGTTRPTILDWEAKGLPRNADSTYDLAACRRWVDERQASQARPVLAAATATEYEDKRAKFQALEAERRYLEAAGKLMDRAEAERRHLQIALTTRAALMSLPDQIAPQVANLPARDVSRILRGRFLAICNQFREGWVPIPDDIAAEIDALVQREPAAAQEASAP